MCTNQLSACEYSKVLVHRYVGIARDRAHRIVDCAQIISICAHIVVLKPDLMVHVRAHVPGTTVRMVHIPEYGILGQGKNQENAPRY